MKKDLAVAVIVFGLCALGQASAAESAGGGPVTIEYYYKIVPAG